MNKKIIGALLPEKLKLIEEKRCPICECPVIMSQFKNLISKKEFEISGMCQKCQDEIFG